ncbi:MULTISPECIES: ADP-ribosylglycohydrolase family protein [unclassified Microbacterium]|uniref:ADP-ribosylglycohydrolase family protein n=1 Tax=unclassified Microbacterium TaxID=2609290 RepID=UPI003656CC01
MTMAETSGATQLSAAFDIVNFNSQSPTNLLHDEVTQRRESGFDVDAFVLEANRIDPTDRDAVFAVLDSMESAPRAEGWKYEEPDTLAEIEAAVTPWREAVALSEPILRDKIHAAWLGRIAGCNIGKPVEWGLHWTSQHIHDYLTLADAYPLTDYVPVLDPMPEGFELTACWPETTRGNVSGSARDDDIDYAILALHLLETHGSSLRPADVASAWTRLFPIEQVFTAERAAYVNLVDGHPVSEAARRRNPYREWIGAQIRGDVFGYVYAGDPWSAARLSYQDASLSHVGNGIYGEMWAAALVSAAFTAETAAEALTKSLTVVPPRSRLAEALRHVIAIKEAGRTWEEALAEIEATYGHYSWVHTINNAAAVAAALLWSNDDFTTGVGRVVMSGWDTDSNGATVGSVLGALVGTAQLPDHIITPLQNRTRSALFGFDNSSISELADRTAQLAINGLG